MEAPSLTLRQPYEELTIADARFLEILSDRKSHVSLNLHPIRFVKVATTSPGSLQVGQVLHTRQKLSLRDSGVL
jgi:hypothetical protein